MPKIEIFIGLLIVVIVWREIFKVGYDDTDNYEKGERSGLNLYVDHRTGLHYIKGGMFGDLIPRLDADGNHIREEMKDE